MQTGNIQQRGASWVLRCREKVLDAKSNKHVWKSRTIRLAPIGGAYRTAASVQELADVHLSKLQSASSNPTSTKTVESFIEQDYLPHVRTTKRPSTANDYACTFKLVQSHLKGLELRGMKPSNVQAILDAVGSEKKLAHTTYDKCKRFLSGVWKFAAVRDLVDGANPIGPCKIPTGRESSTEAYSHAELKKIFAAVKNPETLAAITVLSYTALRIGEVKGLQWGDVDFDAKTITVRRSVWRGIVGEPKTNASKAPVPLSDNVAKALRAHRKALVEPSSESYIFAARNGKPKRFENTAVRELRPAFKKEGIAWKGFHAFRRGVATRMFDAGEDQKTLQAALRHSDSKTTMEWYVKSNAKKVSKAFETDSNVVKFPVRRTA